MEKYIAAEIELIKIENTDIITDSGEDLCPDDSSSDLPIIPIG